MSTVITRTATRLAVPVILVLSVALFVQGHNQPGGGFIGGVLTTTAFALIYVVFGLDFLEEEVLDRAVEPVVDSLESGIVADYRLLFAVGLTVAAASGLVPVFFDVELFAGDAFLGQSFVILHHVPVYGEVEIASALVFDFGVYCTVVGALLTVLSVVGAE